MINETSDTLIVEAKETTLDYMSSNNKKDKEHWIEFKMNPSSRYHFREVMRDLESELPFRELKIYRNRDSLTATTAEEILQLFDRNLFGIKTPYVIRIKESSFSKH